MADAADLKKTWVLAWKTGDDAELLKVGETSLSYRVIPSQCWREISREGEGSTPSAHTTFLLGH
jgi:hypothetical protein